MKINNAEKFGLSSKKLNEMEKFFKDNLKKENFTQDSLF